MFGWGVVAPKSPDIDSFARNLASCKNWLSPFEGFGPGNFLVGVPEFNFDHYQPWVDARFPPRHFRLLKEKMDLPALYAVGSFIQALGQNPGLESELSALGSQAHVYVGTGVGAVDTLYKASIKHWEAQKRWNRFWAEPAHNPELRAFCEHGDPEARYSDVPPDPSTMAGAAREEAEEAWNAYWIGRSGDLRSYLAEFAEIENLGFQGEVESGKLNIIREKEKRRSKLQEKWGTPEPPWHVSANVIWNIHNTPAAQISILGKITGPTFAPVAACSTFGVALKLAMGALQSGEAKAVVVGATDPPPHPLIVGAFHTARVLAASPEVSVPLTRLQGTHVAGGSVVWILGDLDYFQSRGFRPMGMEPLAVRVTSDAHHIITPTADGPRAAILGCLSDTGTAPESVSTWDLHATATPGDYSEVQTLRSLLPETVLISARKGIFGHGMSAGGGWELTAQYLGYERGQVFPTPLAAGDLNREIGALHKRFVWDEACDFPDGVAGKLSMGIGGVNACVLSRPLRNGVGNDTSNDS